jgi:hypothetical protein
MDIKNVLIDELFNFLSDIRYVAVYKDKELLFRERQEIANTSSAESDKYEELIVNPSLLTLARQRGEIDCGGLRFLVIGYGNFNQLIKEISGGHISICLDKKVDLTNTTEKIFAFLSSKHPDLF